MNRRIETALHVCTNAQANTTSESDVPGKETNELRAQGYNNRCVYVCRRKI